MSSLSNFRQQALKTVLSKITYSQIPQIAWALTMEADSTKTYDSSMLDVYTDNRNVLLRFAQKLTGCSAHAEDIVQDAYLRLPSAPKITSSPKAQLSYIFQIVRNLSIDHHRKRTATEKIIDFKEDDSAEDTRTPDKQCQHRETLDIIDQALSELPDRTRYAFEQYRIYGVAQKEIAKELGVSTTLVNFMIRDALLHCKKAADAENGINESSN